jgi:cathepsin A (carboxypeptidase C)
VIGFFKSRNNPANIPVVLWLNWGPHCSLFKGLLYVNGPVIVRGNVRTRNNPYSGNSNAGLLYIDEPAGTGLSVVTNDVYNNKQVAEQLYEFLNKFFITFPQYSNLNFHLSVGSDAGRFIPDLAAEILSHEERTFRLSSLLVGNALLDAALQFQYIQPMFCGEGGVPPVLSAEKCSKMEAEMPSCIRQIEDSSLGLSQNGTEVWNYCGELTFAQYSGNYFDLIRVCASNSTECYVEDELYVKYIHQPRVLDLLQSRKRTFQACNATINDIL